MSRGTHKGSSSIDSEQRCLICVHEQSEEKWADNEWQKHELVEDNSESDADIETNAYDSVTKP